MRLAVNQKHLRAWAWRLRWVGIAIAAGLAVRIALPGVVAAFRPLEDAWVLAHSVTQGQVLAEGDVRLAKVPRGAGLKGAIAGPSDAIGGRAVANLPAGMVLVPELVSRSAVPGGAPKGTVAVPVRLSDQAAAGLLRHGDRIDLLAGSGMGGASGQGDQVSPAQELAQSAVVLDVPGDGLVVLAVSPKESKLIGGAAGWAVLSAVLVG